MIDLIKSILLSPAFTRNLLIFLVCFYIIIMMGYVLIGKWSSVVYFIGAAVLTVGLLMM